MAKTNLNFKQNACAARIFLNIFGLTLENINDDVNEFSKIKIFDRAMAKVGILYIDNGKVIMSANYNNSILDASFAIPKISGFYDAESIHNALNVHWRSKINFQVHKQNNVELSGEFSLINSVDTEFGANCLCSALINCEIFGKENIIMKILRDGKIFNLEKLEGENYELIYISPINDLMAYLYHCIKKGKYDKQKHAYPYRKEAGIYSAGTTDENKDKLNVFMFEENAGEELSFRNEYLLRFGDDFSEEALLQKGRLMQDLDPDMFEKIRKLKEILLIGDVSLLDNIISVCYDGYTNEVLNALLGVNRQKMNYQNGADNLVDSYYEIGISNCFFPLEVQKRLLKK